MGERKGQNKYYPPDFNPEKHGSLNRYHNSHPLRERARKLSQGILIIRFEMPYNICKEIRCPLLVYLKTATVYLYIINE
ncbi:rCG51630, isoform CRA_b [Rattus norvegicus]|uniref:Probable splicing factor YJU2B n=1 Tax=Rattus norvegicus TaxID=10116 RepID=A6IY96_RAT|nr:rCG51630, isoform CRA_b [Rattus norvegicus]